MSATTVASSVDIERDVDDVLDVVFGDHPTLGLKALAAGLDITYWTIRETVRRGDLTTIRVSERRIAVSRAAVRRWLLALQQEGRS